MSVKEGRDHFEIAAELKKRVEGDIRFDRYSRLLYSTDASIYQIEPIGVVVPRHKGDVHAVIEIANKLNVSVLSRGGGTSLAGQAVGPPAPTVPPPPDRGCRARHFSGKERLAFAGLCPYAEPVAHGFRTGRSVRFLQRRGDPGELAV